MYSLTSLTRNWARRVTGPTSENEETRRERIERAGVTDARDAEHAARTRHDVVGRRARRLVDEEGAVTMHQESAGATCS